MNTATQNGLQSSYAQTPFRCGHVSIHRDFIMQSAEYFDLKISHAAAAILIHKDIDASAVQQANRD